MPEIDLTPDEILGLMLEAGLAANKEDALAMWGAITALGGDEVLAALGATLSGGASPEAVAAALALAERETKRIWGDWVKSELDKVGQAVADGLAEGIGPREIARRLDAVKGLDPQRARRYEKMKALLELSDRSDSEIEAMLDNFFKKELRDRKRVIAQFEARTATEKAARIQADDRGQQFKTWITVGDSRVGEDHRGNEAAGWIPIKDAFPTGDQEPPGRPRCRCSVTYRTAPPNEAAKQRAEERAASTEAAVSA